jgi:hypothetical protein
MEEAAGLPGSRFRFCQTNYRRSRSHPFPFRCLDDGSSAFPARDRWAIPCTSAGDGRVVEPGRSGKSFRIKQHCHEGKPCAKRNRAASDQQLDSDVMSLFGLCRSPNRDSSASRRWYAAAQSSSRPQQVAAVLNKGQRKQRKGNFVESPARSMTLPPTIAPPLFDRSDHPFTSSPAISASLVFGQLTLSFIALS